MCFDFYSPLSTITHSITTTVTTSDKGGFFLIANYFGLNIRIIVKENFLGLMKVWLKFSVTPDLGFTI